MPELRGALRAKAFKVPGRADDVRTSGPDRLAGVVVTPRVHIRSKGEWRLPVKSVPLSRLRRMAAFAAAPELPADLVSPLGNMHMRGIPGVAARSGLLRRVQP